MHLQNMRPGEKVYMVLRRHWIIYIMIFLYGLLGLLITIFIYFGAQTLFQDSSSLSLLLAIIFFMGFSIFLYIEWLNHELDMFIVTNNRIIGVEQIKFLDRTVTETNLGQVQEVNHRTKGVFANLLNYGTVYIQTAGNITTLKMDFCCDALQQSRKILNIVDQYRDDNGTMVSKVDSGQDLKSNL